MANIANQMLWLGLKLTFGRSGSVVEHTLGKGEVESSILSCGTSIDYTLSKSLKV